ncbi:ABC transporter ATP-binding protein [Paenibacillus tarimensis]
MEDVSVITSDPLSCIEHTVLNSISLRLSPGEWVQIAGANGSGKSTLVKLLTGQLGMTYRVEGKVTRGFAGRHPVPYVMQHPEASMIGMTPWEDVLIGLEQQDIPEERIMSGVERALLQTGLSEIKQRPVDRLSGGQRQLTAIAGCLASEAPLLVLDEATSMLDAESRRKVLTAVRKLNREGTTVVWVTHRMEEWEPGDRVIALERGRLIYDGDTDGFFTGGTGGGASVCERLGWEPPYTVQTAQELIQLGYTVQPLPLTAEALKEAVAVWK